MSILKQLVFTPRCLICTRLGDNFCLSCLEKIRPFRARKLSEIEGCFCAGDYSGWLRDSVICYKNGDARYTKLLAQVLGRTLDRLDVIRNLTLIPVPSSQQKIIERGFDSIANLCTNMIRERESLTLDTSNLFLRRSVVDQVGLTALQRQENLDGAFGTRRVISGTVVIVDDVITAGTAVRESVDLIKKSGAQPVAVLLALDRQERGAGDHSAVQEVEQQFGLRCVSLLTLADLIASDLPAEQRAALEAYRARYGIKAA